jgi:SAM-dependent methyltransferase
VAERSSDPYAPLKDNSWRELAEIDRRLERGEIDEDGWHAAVGSLVVPAYLAADTPWGQSGKTGDLALWDHSRSLVADAIDRDGAFLDVGCANGFLLESLARWTPYALEPYGLDISPPLVELARRRLPQWADRFFAGNALHWQPPRRFEFVRTGLDYVPARRRRDLVEHLLGFCDRLIVGVYNEEAQGRPTEELLASWGLPIAGRSERRHCHPEMRYRAVWIDA